MVALVSDSPVSRLNSLPPSVDVKRESRLPLPAHPQWTGTALVQSIAAALWDRMPFAKLDLSLDHDRTELARIYADSDQALQKAASDVADMLESLRDSAHVLRQDPRISSEQRAQWQLRQRESLNRQSLNCPIVPPDTALNFKTAGESGLAGRLEEALRERVQRFATDLVQSLQGLSDQHVLGKVEWANEKDCRLTFHRFVLSQKSLGTAVTEEVVYDAPTAQLATVKVAKEKIRNTSSVARHEHDLIDACQNDVSRTIEPIPQSVQTFVNSVPEWLRPLLQVVEGKLIRERITERETQTQEWSSRPQEISRTLHERVVFSSDPALVLGEFILMGWGEREIAAERERRRYVEAAAASAVSEQTQSENSGPASVIGRGALGASIAMCLLAYTVTSPVCLYASWGLGFLAVWMHFLSPKLSKGQSGFLCAGRALLVVLGFQLFLYGMAGAGILLILMAGICAVGWLITDTDRR